MDWLATLDISAVGKSLLQTLWNRDGNSFLPDPDMARNVLVGAVTFFFGWILSLRGSRRRLKQRIIDELLMTQRELARRAYPDEYGGEWRQDDPREVWMLEPLVSRIQFLVSNLTDERSVSRDARTLMDVYVESVRDFIAEWSQTKTRFIGATFETKFLRTHDVVVALGRAMHALDSSRTRGLLPKRFQMRTRFVFEAPAHSSASADAPLVAPKGRLDTTPSKAKKADPVDAE